MVTFIIPLTISKSVFEIYLGILTRIEMIRDGIKYIKASRRSPLKIKETQN